MHESSGRDINGQSFAWLYNQFFGTTSISVLPGCEKKLIPPNVAGAILVSVVMKTSQRLSWIKFEFQNNVCWDGNGVSDYVFCYVGGGPKQSLNWRGSYMFD